jgi:hypothetical protein
MRKGAGLPRTGELVTTKANEYPTRLAGRTISAQAGCQVVAHIPRQGHAVVKQPLASNADLAGPPVDIIKLESNHLIGAETEMGQQKKDGVVAAAARSATVAGFEDTFDFIRSQVLGHGG